MFLHQICPEMHGNEIHVPHNRHLKVSSFMKSQQNTEIISNMKYMKMFKSPVGHEVLCKQYLRAFLDISVCTHPTVLTLALASGRALMSNPEAYKFVTPRNLSIKQSKLRPVTKFSVSSRLRCLRKIYRNA